MRRILSYLVAGYIGAAVAFVLPFHSTPYLLVSTGAQFVAIVLGVSY